MNHLPRDPYRNGKSIGATFGLQFVKGDPVWFG